MTETLCCAIPFLQTQILKQAIILLHTHSKKALCLQRLPNAKRSGKNTGASCAIIISGWANSSSIFMYLNMRVYGRIFIS